uniref:Putative secreted protein n=1 Tax=Anopheles marajoara TaxID=58244 RepID=A0A2M4CA85_9DIPT
MLLIFCFVLLYWYRLCPFAVPLRAFKRASTTHKHTAYHFLTLSESAYFLTKIETTPVTTFFCSRRAVREGKGFRKTTEEVFLQFFAKKKFCFKTRM